MAQTRAVAAVTPERWARVKEVLGGAMEIVPNERAAWLDRACDGDAELRREVDSLLSAADAPWEIASPFAITSAEQAVLETALGQQYEILRRLGQGGMGAVYLARERALDRFVAIKILRPDLAAAPEIRERFRREARIAAHLSHPSILPLHTFGEVRGIWYFVMGYVHGSTLAERLRRDGALSSEETQRILLELTEAVECAHRSGVIHRDITPSNVLLDDASGRAMLADFGISKLHDAPDRLTIAGAVMGTPNFMSPEQAVGSPDVDERSDLYSLGAVGYAMLTGRDPFADVRPQELTHAKLSRDPAPIHSIAPSVPADLAAVVMRCLARKPESRWPSARALRQALRRASGDPVALPEALRDLPTFAPYALLWGVAWTLLAVATPRSLLDTVLLLLVAAIVPIGLVLHIWTVGRHGLAKRDLLRVAFWPPEWWGMWWPRAWRRPNDIWRRLPWQARAVRGSLSAIFILLPAMVLARERFDLAGYPRSQPILTAELLLVTVALAIIGASLLWTMVRGLGASDSVRLLIGSTAPVPGWNSPSLASLISPPPGRLRQPDRDTPADYVRAIADLIAGLPDSVANDLACATATARRVIESIEQHDRAMVAISAIAGREEIERLESELTRLDGQRSEHSANRDEMQLLVRRQLELVREMRAEHEAHSERRLRLFDLLRAVWTHLSPMANATPDDAGAALADRVRSVCAEIDATLADVTPIRTVAAEAVSRAAGSR